MRELMSESHAREELLDITDLVQRAVRDTGISDGIVVIQSAHTTLGLTVNENADPAVAEDMLVHLGRLVPRTAVCQHMENHSDGHIKVSLVGPSLSLIVHQGQVQLGTWQGIFACEFDGLRRRRLWLEIVGR